MKTIKLICLLFFFLSASAFSQENEQQGCTKHMAISAKMNFEKDLKNERIVIYVRGGIVAAITEADRKFEKEYAIQYRDFGCLTPGNPSYYENYNHHVFSYLKEKHGNDCVNLINKSAFGRKS